MRKTFGLTAPGKDDARVLESIKHEVRKYVKRERKKPIPPEFELWNFDCKVGADHATAESMSLREVGAAIDAVASTGAGSVYLEITAVPSRRTSSAKPAIAPLQAESPLTVSANSDS